MKTEMILGVDGGGSKTHLALAGRDGRLLAMEAGPGTNLEAQKPGETVAILSGILARACRRAGVSPGGIRASCFGMSGVDIAQDIPHAGRNITGKLGLSGPRKVHNDAFLALFSAGWKDRGAVVTVGTGHKWLAVNGRREAMHDGLVYPGLKDMIMEELLKAAEGYSPHSGFTSRMYRRFGFRSTGDFIRRWRYGGSRDYVKTVPASSWRRIAGVQELLGREADSGDKLALELVDRYARMLAEGTMVAVRRAKAAGSGLEVVMSGSVLAGIRPLQSAFRRHLRVYLPGAAAVPAVFRPIRGALVFAAHQAWRGLPPESLLESQLRY